MTEYRNLMAEGITPATNVFASTFFTLTGFHGIHVLLGLVALAIVAGLTAAGQIRPGRHVAGVEAVGYYWHFVDGIWVVILSLVYLWALL